MNLGPLTRRAVHILLPASCASCGASLRDDPIPFFCRACWGGIQPLAGPECPRCGRPFASSTALCHSPGHRCGECRKKRPAYTRAWSFYPYDATVRDAIRLFKYQGKLGLADSLTSLMKAAWRELAAFDLIMPVPLHPSRLREREFNQSLMLADRLSRWLHLPMDYDNLIRVRATKPQTQLSRAQRRNNLRRSFMLRHQAAVGNQRVLLVDDVFTTGTTVNECAKTLRIAGSSDVYVVTLARTV